jgi:D-alanine-D-alanine ligase
VKAYALPKIIRQRSGIEHESRPGTVLVAYSAVEALGRGEAKDIETDLETIDTAKALAKNLREVGYNADTYVVNSMSDIDLLADEFDVDDLLVFNLCEHLKGVVKDDHKIATRMDLLGIQYTGAGPATLHVSLNKSRTKRILEHHLIPTAPHGLFEHDKQRSSVPLPAIVKPVAEDASMGITRDSVVFNNKKLQEQVQYVLDVYRQPAIVEEFIAGREFNVGVWGNGHTHVLPIAELNYDQWSDPYQQFLHYDAKWNPDCKEYQTMPVMCPAPVDAPVAKRIRDVAYRAFQALGCRDYARVDMRLRDGVPYVLEVNANPCLAHDAGFPNAAREAGYTYPYMTKQIADWAWWRRGKHA